MKKQFFLIIALFAGLQLLKAHTSAACPVPYADSAGKVITESMAILHNTGIYERGGEGPNPVHQLFRKKHRMNKKIVAAVLAFPFPFGIVGLHRIYMGTKPYVPVVYIATIGGVFGILPFIDFCVLMFDKDFKRYENNGKVFMWIKPDEKSDKK
jgi:TM2 domain-containing membrane protein YozV